MKSFYILLFVFFMGSLPLLAQTGNDQEQIIQKCLTFQPLEEILPAETRQQISEYLILEHGVEFIFSEDFKVSGKSVSLINKEELSQDKPFFDFFIINIENDKASVVYYVNYSINNTEHTVSVTIQFEKCNSDWDVANYTL